jgi:hypothetical protein
MSTPGPDGPPPRVRVTSPRTAAPRTRRVAPASEIDARTRLGEIYLSSLVRTQLRLALGVLAVLAVSVGGLPLLFRAFPRLTATEVLAMPLAWVLLAFAVYPFLVLVGWAYVRRAERNEQVFAAMVSPRAEDER